MDTDPTEIYPLTSYVSRKTPIPDATNNSVEPTEAFKISYATSLKPLHSSFQLYPMQPKKCSSIWRISSRNSSIMLTTIEQPCLIQKNLLLVISAPLNILPGHLQYHQTHSSTALNLNSYLKYEATIKTHRLQKSKNHMVIDVPPPNPSGSCTTISSSDVCINRQD